MPDHLMLYKMNCLAACCSWDRKRGHFKFFFKLHFWFFPPEWRKCTDWRKWRRYLWGKWLAQMRDFRAHWGYQPPTHRDGRDVLIDAWGVLEKELLELVQLVAVVSELLQTQSIILLSSNSVDVVNSHYTVGVATVLEFVCRSVSGFSVAWKMKSSYLKW